MPSRTPDRSSDSKLSNSSSRQDMPGISAQVVNPHLSREEFEELNIDAYEDDSGKGKDRSNRNLSDADERHDGQQTGSGLDKNSDTRRLYDPQNLQDKVDEDTFPASDPPSNSPMTGVGPRSSEPEREPEREPDRSESQTASRPSKRSEPEELPEDFKDNKGAQFEYGRRSQAKTQHFDTSTRRLEHGNPDVGEIDLGNIESNRPADPDDKDHFD